MRASNLTVEVRNKDLKRVGIIRPSDLVLDIEELFNNLGTWKVELPVEHPLSPVLRTPGSGIIITGPTDVVISGPMTKATVSHTSNDPGGTVEIEGVSDTIHLRDRLAFPDPLNANPMTQTLAHDVRTGAVETIMHGYVNANIGPLAPVARRITGLTMGVNGGRGAVVRKTARFPVLGNLLSDLAASASLGFRIVQRGTGLVFETYAVTDRSATIRLDVDNNTLASQTVAISPPGLTRAIVAGQGDLTNRTFFTATTPESLSAEAAWGRRIERFIDQRQTNDTTELTQAANEALMEEGFTSLSVKAKTMDDTTMVFLKDWGLGDRVSVVSDDGQIVARVSGVVVKIDSSGGQTGILLGDEKAFDVDMKVAGRVANTVSRVSNLERNAENGATTQQILNADAGITTLNNQMAGVLDPFTAFVGTFAFQNSWTNYALGFEAASYRKVGKMVYLQGLLKGGVVGSSMFTLPVGYRPADSILFAISSNNALGRVDINNVGNVICLVGNNTYVSISGIAYEAA